jgi:Xaa-Pro aminopeptidase
MGASADAALLAARRARIMERLGDGAVLLLAAAPERVRSADVLHPYRQDSDFAYVTGFTEPEAVCVLAPGHAEPFALFVRPHDPERAVWDGARAGIEGATRDHGASIAHPIDALERELPTWLNQAREVHLDLGREDPLAGRLLAAVRRAEAARPRSGAGPGTIRSAADILHELRLVKEPAEVDALRHAVGIACEAHREALTMARPGMREFEVEALVNYGFRRRGAAGPAYPSIVAAGANATILHYVRNDAPLVDGDLLLVDAGDECAGYCADVTRTFPIGRAFSSPQRDLYAAVLAAQTAAIETVRPGTTLPAIHATAVRTLTEALVDLGLLEGPVDRAVEQDLYRPFYMHRTSHWLGRDVHDVGSYKDGETPRPLVPGMVFTVEPGCYVAPDADAPDPFRGIGIRIEDDVLVTPDGVEVLSAAAPKAIAEVEAARGAARG